MADRIKIVAAEEAHIAPLVADMREQDRHEVWAFSGRGPEQALLRGVKRSDACLTVLGEDGEVAAMFGVAPLCRMTGTGIPWLLAANSVKKYRREFLEFPGPYLQGMLILFPQLVNYVHIDNKDSIRWLKWLGFTIEEPLPTGVKQELFHRFHMGDQDV